MTGKQAECTDLEARSRLAALHRRFDACTCCAQTDAETGRALKHVWGAGQVEHPRLMLVLMNPTGRNVTLQAEYSGRLRMPYAGVDSLWQVLIEAGILPTRTLDDLPAGAWSDAHTRYMTDALASAGLYLTELVKCPSAQAIVPGKALLEHNRPWFEEEVDIVRPRAIVAFGLWVVQALTGRSIRLRDHLEALRRGELPAYPWVRRSEGPSYPVYPCYFPTGRGQRSHAVECLRVYSQAETEGVRLEQRKSG